MIGILFYITPSIIALIFGKKNTIIIILLNLVMGWFLPAWVILLIWAVIAEYRQVTEYSADYNVNERSCQFCTKFFPKNEDICPHCGRKQIKIDY